MVHDVGFEDLKADRDVWRAHAYRLEGQIMAARDENARLRDKLDSMSASLEDARDDLEHYKRTADGDTAEEWKRKYWEAQAELDQMYDDRTQILNILDPPPKDGFTMKWHPGAEALSVLWKNVGYTDSGLTFSTP